MSTPPAINDEQVWKQMLQYLDGSLPEDDVATLNQRLKNDPELRGFFGDLILQQIKLQEIGQEEQIARDTEAEEELIATEENIIALPQRECLVEHAAEGGRQKDRLRKRFQNYRVLSGLAMAASVVLIGVAVWLFFMPATLATVAMSDRGVVIERGSSKFQAKPGTALRAGDRVVTPGSGRAMFTFNNEPTEVTVYSGTRLGVDMVRESKQLTLDHGAFVADVAKQDPNRPLILVTPQAEAVVVGTRFKLSTADALTKLEVFEGAVRIKQGEKGASTQVPAGHFATVEPGRPVSLALLPRTIGGVQLEHWLTGGRGATNELTLNQLMFSGIGDVPGGIRVRGYLNPPLSGAYLFQLNANAKLELKVSDSMNPAHAKTIVATEDGYSKTMSSEVVLMQAGKRYYFELAGISEKQPANFTVSWKMPGGMHRVVYGEYLSPFDLK